MPRLLIWLEQMVRQILGAVIRPKRQSPIQRLTRVEPFSLASPMEIDLKRVIEERFAALADYSERATLGVPILVGAEDPSPSHQSHREHPHAIGAPHAGSGHAW